MSATTPTDLLRHAARIAADLATSSEPVTHTHWETFDVTLHRALNTLINATDLPRTGNHRALLRSVVQDYPRPLQAADGLEVGTREAGRVLGIHQQTVLARIHRGDLTATRTTAGDYLILARQLDDNPRIHPARTDDPHPLARLSRTLGAFADQLTCSPTVARRPGVEDALPAITELLTIARYAARHALTHGDYDLAPRASLIGQHAHTTLQQLADLAPRAARVGLEGWRAVTPDRESPHLNDRLETTIHDWRQAATDELDRWVPSADTLKAIAGQGFQLLAVTHQLAATDDTTPAEQLDGLAAAARSLRAARQAYQPYTTLARPSAEFVDASRALYAALVDTQHALATGNPALDRARARVDLDAATKALREMLARPTAQPIGLAAVGLLYAPAKTLPANETRLTARTRGATVKVTPGDVSTLHARWTSSLAELDRVADRGISPSRAPARRTHQRDCPTIDLGPEVA